ncbi:hypothetical protein [Rhizobacter sp. AJA081-3]|uniref:ATP-binding protein n=1 Tax=Rhizobacter sp. AJA081-3 TaxID=2753607 RepID=UPI001ADFF336|nr:hypothetical protein [Rhizobacter sp. AJA081-3]
MPDFGVDTAAFTGQLARMYGFLAVRQDWVSRDELAALFWPDSPAPVSRGNVRNLIHKLLQLPRCEGVESLGRSIRCTASTDLAHFHEMVRCRDWHHVVHQPALELLAGLEAGASEPFRAWLAFERSRLLQAWRDAVLMASETDALEPAERLALVDAALLREPANEDFEHAAFKALAALGRSSEIPVRFAAFAQRAFQASGVPPSSKLREFVAGLNGSHADAAQVDAADGPAIVGRRLELMDLNGLLDDGQARLVTLLGPGGVGKTTLARHLFNGELAAGRVRAVWVDLLPAAAVPDALTMIAQALGLRIPGGAEPLAVLCTALRETPLRLYLDNVEQIGGLGDVLQTLLEGCTRLRIVATSRHALEVDAEWRFQVDGLPIPDAQESDAGVLTACDSVRLYLHCCAAGHVRNGPGTGVRVAASVARFAQGHPLTIALMASCAADLTEQQVEALDRERSFAALGGGADAAQAALNASFARSWTLLSDAERGALPRLTCFPTSFDAAAAWGAAGVPLMLLRALVDKSLVQPEPHARFSLHSSVRSFAAQHLDDPADGRRRHAAYYGRIFATLDHIDLVLLARANDGLDREWTNALAAWDWAFANRDAALAGQLLYGLFELAEGQGRGDVMQSLGNAVHQIIESWCSLPANCSDQVQRIRMIMQARTGPAEMRRVAMAALEVATKARSITGTLEALGFAALGAMLEGDRVAAGRYVALALRRTQRHRRVPDQIYFLTLQVTRSDWQQISGSAWSVCRMARRLLDEIQPRPFLELMLLAAEAEVLARLGDMDAARHTLVERLRLAKQWKTQGALGSMLLLAASVELETGMLPDAEAHLGQAEDWLAKGWSEGVAQRLELLHAQLAILRADMAPATARLIALVDDASMSQGPNAAWLVFLGALWHRERGQLSRALAFAGAAARAPSEPALVRQAERMARTVEIQFRTLALPSSAQPDDEDRLALIAQLRQDLDDSALPAPFGGAAQTPVASG